MSHVTTSAARMAGVRRGLPLLAVLAVCACQAGGGKPMALSVKADTPVLALQRINEAAAKCWHKSGDRVFGDLRTIPELDTSAGTPRLLVVRASEAQGLPRMVIEASGNPVTVRTYGPLVTSVTGARINRDITRWSAGATDCKA